MRSTDNIDRVSWGSLSTIAWPKRVPNLLAAFQSANTTSASHIALTTQDEHVAMSRALRHIKIAFNAVGVAGSSSLQEQTKRRSVCAIQCSIIVSARQMSTHNRRLRERFSAGLLWRSLRHSQSADLERALAGQNTVTVLT